MTNYSDFEERLRLEHGNPLDKTLIQPAISGASKHLMENMFVSSNEVTPLMNFNNYDTFAQPTFKRQLEDPAIPRQIRIIPPPEQPTFIDRLCCCLMVHHPSQDGNGEGLNKELGIDFGAWTTVVIISILIAIVAYSFHGDAFDSTSPSWHFDYNVYISRAGSVQRSSRVALIAQVASSRPLEKFSLISSRPNRAYAKFWGQDYVRYNAGLGHVYQRSCFDKVYVLNQILSQQLVEDDDDESNTLPRWNRRPYEVNYDSIIIIPPDSIIIELDTDIIESMLPKEKLVAIAGWDSGNKVIDSHSGIVAFNLNHPYTRDVAKTWRELILPMEETCGANNDLAILIAAIYAAMDENEFIEDLVEPVKENREGYTGGYMIKSLLPTVPGYRDKYLERTLVESKSSLQKTVASVCYRFYPKCEVV